MRDGEAWALVSFPRTGTPSAGHDRQTLLCTPRCTAWLCSPHSTSPLSSEPPGVGTALSEFSQALQAWRACLCQAASGSQAHSQPCLELAWDRDQTWGLGTFPDAAPPSASLRVSCSVAGKAVGRA